METYHICVCTMHMCVVKMDHLLKSGVYMHTCMACCARAGRLVLRRSTDGGSRVLGEAAVVLSGKSNAVSAYVCSIRVQ